LEPLSVRVATFPVTTRNSWTLPDKCAPKSAGLRYDLGLRDAGTATVSRRIVRGRWNILLSGRYGWRVYLKNLEKGMAQARSEYEIVQDQLARLLRRKSDLLAVKQPVPPELEDEIDELNKDLEFLHGA